MSKESAAWDRSVEYLGEIVVEHRNSSRDFARFYRLLATSKNGTLCYPRDQVMDEGPVSSLRALL
jgi:hypothetical protein